MGLNNCHTGFTNVNAIQMIAHLYDNYGFISPAEKMGKKKRMEDPYDSAGPINTHFHHTETTVYYAEVGNIPYTLDQIIEIAFLQIYSTGLYKDECTKRNRLSQKIGQNVRSCLLLPHESYVNSKPSQVPHSIMEQQLSRRST